MITFKTIKIQNFASIGNKPLEFDYTKFNIGLVTGNNGAGKSQTFLYSLYYALYGKSFSKTTLGALINNINKKGLLVELTFSIGSNDYLIRRGMKPNLFEIYVNGKLKPQPSTTKEYQTWLETQVLKMDEKTFRQLVVYGSSSYIPFMRLSASERRVVVEDMLNLGIFSKMLELSKIELASVVESGKKVSASILEKSHQKDVLEAKKKEREEVTGKVIEELETSIASANEKIMTLQDAFSAISISKEEYEAAEKEVSKFRGILDEAKTLRVKISTLKSQSSKRQSFFESNEVCPTCERQIDSDLKHKMHEETSKKIEEYEKNLASFDQKMQSVQKKLEAAEEFHRGFVQKVREKNSISEEISKKAAEKKSLESRLESMKGLMQESYEEDNAQIAAFKKEIENLDKEKAQWEEKATALQALQSLLKDDGVKSNIIKSYIPLLNQYIRNYLEIMNFPITFEFDETFEAHIADGHSDSLEYGSRSQGEQMRINYACLMALREIVKIRSSISTNLLLLDESDGGCMDSEGFQALTQILSSLTGTNILIISHSEDEYTSISDNIYVVEKVNGFTRLKNI